nr:rubrerythrin family protein [Synergistales bacterium]
MKKTMENLAAAFAGESQANRKYLAFAKQADKEGYSQVAKLFRAVAEAETIHAHSHLKEMGGINSTEENLRSAMEGEIYEFSEMYPEFIEVARKEGAKSSERTFHFANEAEKAHAELYRKALEGLGSEKEVEYYLCP